MAKKITISGEIGWGYTSNDIRSSLAEAKGDDIELDIASPGGDVFDGIEIFNAIRDYKKSNPKSQISASLKGLVASMATYIASNPAIDLVTAEDNAVYMVHNPWMFALGDYNEMNKTAELLEGLAGILATAYQSRSGKSPAEVRSMMDDETWLFGAEIKEAGFVDEMIDCPDGECGTEKKDKKKALSFARASFEAMKRNAQEKTDSTKVAAMVRAYSSTIVHSPGFSGEKDTTENEGGEMKTLAELKTTSPELYKELEESTTASAVAAERTRISALLAMKEKHGQKVGAVAELVDKAVSDGRTAEAIALSVVDLVSAAADSAPPLNTGANGTASGEPATSAIPNAPTSFMR